MPRQKDISLTFGKYNGVLIADIPNQYLGWIMDQNWFCSQYPGIAKQVEIELIYRNKFDIIID
jgi:uncharacterized protein (DUF3820 family)